MTGQAYCVEQHKVPIGDLHKIWGTEDIGAEKHMEINPISAAQAAVSLSGAHHNP